MIEVLAAVVLASSPSPSCLTAARRMTEFMIQEAKGTRHESQIAEQIDKAGGLDNAVVQIAGTMEEDACAFLIAAPDSAVRAMAIANLPERSGD